MLAFMRTMGACKLVHTYIYNRIDIMYIYFYSVEGDKECLRWDYETGLNVRYDKVSLCKPEIGVMLSHHFGFVCETRHRKCVYDQFV